MHKKRKLPINLKEIILFLIVLFPFIFILKFVIEISYNITVPYFLSVNLLVFIDLLIRKINKIQFLKISFPYFLLIIIIFINTESFQYSMPLVFVSSLYMINIYVISHFNYLENKKIIRNFILLFILISVFLFLFGIGYSNDNRFNSFLLSATTFSAYLTLIFLLSTILLNNNKYIFLIYLLSLILIWYSGTRLNFIFIILLPFIYFFIQNKLVSKKIFYFSFVGILFFIYPAYQLVVSYFPILIYRYSGGVDTSYNLRINLFTEVYNNYNSGTLLQKLFGKGSEFSREMIKQLHGIDLFPHNDFIRFLNDFGLIAFILLIYIFYKLSKQGGVQVFIAILLYYLMFYSNMIYNLFYIYLLFIILALTKKKVFN